MTSTTNTPGFNCRVAIFFTVDKNGRKSARYYGKSHVFRSFPMPLADAEMFLANDLADRV